ncbi:L,D-transpeptidase family protein [Chelatococcus sp. SYSU_G07232]|uniref:L,D-transpeptidase family protein n=1 Tax=Chelatococcus albus TaxID=3047466 RepID=A0ABT7AH47_9HYPH|nr:L,D-transpeptidase family protein [Chelatococcus sp. SYSU_G07232]MDJ1158702.1 L,D-transpeptidase family protein [Chelatococcus sp. SYSU_G07232]
MKRTTLRSIRVLPRPGDRRRGVILAGPLALPCALGRSGTGRTRREGDGRTPIGRFALGALYFRADRLRRPRTRLPLLPLRPNDGWCDDPADTRYNRPVKLPYRAGHERLWRDDHLYDLVLDISFNRGPILRGRGSAIFLHLARQDFAPTAGCIAIAPRAARRLLALLGPETTLIIG